MTAELLSAVVAIATALFAYWQYKEKTKADAEVESLKLEIEDKRVEVESDTQQQVAEEAAWARYSAIVREQDARIKNLEDVKEALHKEYIAERRECSKLIEAARDEMQDRIKKLRIENDADQLQLRSSIKELQRLCSDQESQIQSQHIIIERLQRRRGMDTDDPTQAGGRRVTDPKP